MTGRLFLHIGVMKSATSYVQSLCEENADILADTGMCWIGEDLRYEGVRDLLGRGSEGRDGSNGRALAAQLRRLDTAALLSNEMLAGLGTAQARRLVNSLPASDLRVVVTARVLTRIIPSHWQTTIKNGRTWTWDDFAADVCTDQPGKTASWFWRRHRLPDIIARWSEVVPLDHITLVTVPRTGESRVVAQRFGSVVGVDLESLEQPVDRRNPSLGAYSAELLRRLNESMSAEGVSDPDNRYRRSLGAALASQADLEPVFALTAEQHEWVVNEAAGMVDELDRLGVRVVGDLNDLLGEQTPLGGSVDPGWTSEAHLLAAATRGLAGLAEVFATERSRTSAISGLLATAESRVAALEVEVGRLRDEVDSLEPSRAAPAAGPSWVARVRSAVARIPGLRPLVRRLRG